MSRRTGFALGAIACLCACRFNFDLAGAGGSDAGSDSPDADIDALASCTATGWREPAGGQPFGSINTLATEWAAEISDDGLQLIFTGDSGTEHHHLHMAERASLTAPFGPPQPLAINSDDATSEDRDLTFTATELYFVSGPAGGDQCIYVSDRVATPAIWGPPRRLDGLCPRGYLGGLYLSRDGKHLYYDLGNDTLMATRGPGGAFDAPGELVAGLSGMTFCTLTGDELTAYCEHRPAGENLQLWQATRPELGAAFGDRGPVLGAAQPGFEFGDPSITPDGAYLLYARGLDGQQDLQLLQRECL